MLGAIIGDVVGSFYEILEIEEKRKNSKRSYEERIKILDPKTPLFTKECSVTDDSILTCALYDAIVNGHCEYEKYLREYGLRELRLGLDMYGRSRFGKGFVDWLKKDNEGISYANGGAMRISAVGFLFDTLEEVKKNTYLATVPSHNNPEALKSAEAVSTSIFLLRQGMSKSDVQKYVEENYYKLDFSIEDLQRNYTFSAKASESVPEALFIFFTSNSFEEGLRNALSIGGDTDTIAAIVGSLSEACYGIPKNLKEGVKPYLRDYMYNLLESRYFNKEKVKEKKDEKNN